MVCLGRWEKNYMSATQYIWGKIRTARVTEYNPTRWCGLAIDLASGVEIYFEMNRSRKVSANDNGDPYIKREVFNQPPRVGNKILYILDNRPPTYDSEKPRAYVWGYKHFYLRDAENKNGLAELEKALNGKVIPMKPNKPARNGHQSVIITETAPVLTVLPQAKLPATIETTVREWSPGIFGPDTESLTGESGEETSGDKSPEELVMAAGGCNRGKKPKPGENGWTDGRGRKGRGYHQEWRRRH